MEQVIDAKGAGKDGEQHKPEHLVEIKVDDQPRTVPMGKYQVSDLKKILGIPPDYELDLVVDGEFKALADDSDIQVHKNQVFVSHTRRGGSS